MRTATKAPTSRIQRELGRRVDIREREGFRHHFSFGLGEGCHVRGGKFLRKGKLEKKGKYTGGLKIKEGRSARRPFLRQIEMVLEFSFPGRR